MNASSWKKAADFVTQQSVTTQNIHSAATTDSQQLHSLPLSQLSVDDSGPPQVNYGIDHPLASSTPHAPSTPDNITEPAEHDRQITPGIPNQLYPTITADNEAHLPTPGDHQRITDNINTELNKYLEEVAEKRKAEDNYFEGFDKATNTLPKVQKVFQHQETDDTPLEDSTPKETLEFLQEDTGTAPEYDNTNEITIYLPFWRKS